MMGVSRRCLRRRSAVEGSFSLGVQSVFRQDYFISFSLIPWRMSSGGGNHVLRTEPEGAEQDGASSGQTRLAPDPRRTRGRRLHSRMAGS